MNLSVVKHSVEYLYKICVAGSAHPEQIPYYRQKPACLSPDAAPPLPRRWAPETVGISSRTMDELLHALEAMPGAHLHNVLVERNGRLIVAASAPGYSPRIPTLTHSVAKSITSFAVGLLIGDGRLHLDDRIVDIFRDELPSALAPRMKAVTVRHLLTMTAGVTGIAEAASVTIEDWKRAFLSERPTFEPGTDFFYNSMNSYMLAATVEKITGQPLEKLLGERVFAPLGITQYMIECSPEGIAKGGWGMYLTPIDLLKLGRMLADGGRWKGRQILPADYVAEATTAQVRVRDVFGPYDYGYHIWVARDGSATLFNGMLGQNLWCGKNGVIALYTSGNNEFFGDAATLARIVEAVGAPLPTSPIHPSPTATRTLRRTEQNFFCRRAGAVACGRHEDVFSPGVSERIPDGIRRFAGVYQVERNNMGIMPFIWRLIQNSHTPGIVTVAVEVGDREGTLTVTEGETAYHLPFGFGAYRYTTIVYGEEPYLVGALCRCAEGEDGDTVLHFSLVFPEIPNSRRMTLRCRGDGQVVVSLSEAPGVPLLSAVLSALGSNEGKRLNVYTALRRHLDDRAIRNRMLHCIEPVLYAARGEREVSRAVLPGIIAVRDQLGKIAAKTVRRRKRREK